MGCSKWSKVFAHIQAHTHASYCALVWRYAISCACLNTFNLLLYPFTRTTRYEAGRGTGTELGETYSVIGYHTLSLTTCDCLSKQSVLYIISSLYLTGPYFRFESGGFAHSFKFLLRYLLDLSSSLYYASPNFEEGNFSITKCSLRNPICRRAPYGVGADSGYRT